MISARKFWSISSELFRPLALNSFRLDPSFDPRRLMTTRTALAILIAFAIAMACAWILVVWARE
jgi:hypothetical protein